MQIVPGDLCGAHEMSGLSFHVFGDACVPGPSCQGLGHTRGIATSMQQLDQCPPRRHGDGSAGVTFNTVGKPVRSRLIVPKVQAKKAHLVGCLGP